MRAAAADGRLEALVGPTLLTVRPPIPTTWISTPDLPTSFTVAFQSDVPTLSGDRVAFDAQAASRAFVSYSPSSSLWRIFRTGSTVRSAAFAPAGRIGAVAIFTPNESALFVNGAHLVSTGGSLETPPAFRLTVDSNGQRPWPGMGAAWIIPRSLSEAEARHASLALAGGTLT